MKVIEILEEQICACVLQRPVRGGFQKVRIAKIGLCSFLVDGGKGKTGGQEDEESQISARQVAAAPLPTDRQGACSARSRLFLGT